MQSGWKAAPAEAGVAYRHHKELAPTTELRHRQDAEDARQRVGKRSRVELAPEYRRRYTQEILDPSRPRAARGRATGRGGGGAVLRRTRPRGMPRLDRAERLAAEHGVVVLHLRP